MARIAGINIPPHKHAEIGLTAIYGIGRARARAICEAAGVAYSKKVKDLNDAELERLRDEFARATDERQKKALAEKVQLRAIEIGTHANVGEYMQPAAIRKGVVSGIVPAAAQVYWNVRKQRSSSCAGSPPPCRCCWWWRWSLS